MACWLDLREKDCIFCMSFRDMVGEAFRSGKHFLVAKMTSRSDADLSKTTYQLYNAYSVLRLIFKMRGAELVGRYHSRVSFFAKNPLTNCVSLELSLTACVANH